MIDSDGLIDEGNRDARQGKEAPYSTFENMMQVVRPILHTHGFVFY